MISTAALPTALWAVALQNLRGSDLTTGGSRLYLLANDTAKQSFREDREWPKPAARQLTADT